MIINLLLITVFTSIVIYAGIDWPTGIIGTTRLNGTGCVCHNVNNNESINVWIEGPDSVLVSDSSEYKIYLSGGSAVKGGFNVAVMFGTLQSADSTSHVDFNELTHSFPLEFTGDTICWSFKYIASDSIGTDTIYSVANSTNNDGNPQVGDEWNFGENFAVNIVEEFIPVEFISFTASQRESNVLLIWSTASETNNFGFEIHRANDNNNFVNIGFVKGNGTTAIHNEYNFIDDISLPGNYRYRLNQIDFDGNYKYSEVININIVLTDFSLAQNYPNPFNPSTSIQYTVGSRQLVTLKVFDVLGNEIATLVNEQKPAGTYEVKFSSDLIHQSAGGGNGSKLTSGVYFYQLRAGKFSETKKMLVIK
jgi:hypothetical protein